MGKRIQKVSLNNLGSRVLELGYVGEHEHTRIEIDCTDVLWDYPNAECSMVVQPPTGDMYPLTPVRDENSIIWLVTDSDVVYAGTGRVQITFTNDGEIVKSAIANTRIDQSIMATGPVPTPLENWMEQAEETARQMGQDVADATLEDLAEAKEECIAEIEQAGADTRATIPADYTQLSDDVSSLKSALNEDTIEKSVTFSAVPGEWINTDAAPETQNGFSRTEYINCEGWMSFNLSGETNVDPYYHFYAFYDANKNPITNRLNGIVYGTDVSVNSNAVYMIYASSLYTIANVSISATVPTRLKKIEDEINTIETDVVSLIPQKSISQDLLSFAEIDARNIFNYEDPTVVYPGYWYYATTLGSTVQLDQNAATLASYCAFKIPCPKIRKITANYVPSKDSGKLFWIGAVDEDMKLKSYVQANTVLPYTFNIPEGTAYVLMSMQISPTNASDYLPYLVVAEGTSVTEYAPYSKPVYMLSDVKIADDNSNDYLKLPDSYDLVVGDTFQLFYKGIINETRSDLFDVKVKCSKGNGYERFFEITPTTAETLTLNVSVYDPMHKLLDSKDVSLIIRSKKSSPSSRKNILCVGDSLTTSGVWVKELQRRLTGSGGTPAGDGLSNIYFIGTRSYDGVNYEGYGGWTFNSYNTENVSTNSKIITCSHDKTEAADQHSIYKDSTNNTWKLETIESGSIKIMAVSGDGSNFPSTGTLTWVSGGTNHSSITYTASTNAPGNPFWDSSANKVDFGVYATNLGVSSIDYVYVLLGWNNAGMSESSYKQQAQTFITNVHTSFPNAKIILIGIEIPARDGLATNYGATGIYADYTQLIKYVFSLDEWYADLAEDNSNTYSMNLSGQFDTKYNMPTTQVQVNTRNATMIDRQSNGVHPAMSGQYQIADAVYRNFMGK